MFLIRAWLKNQGEGVRRILAERKRRAEASNREPQLLAPFSLSWVRVQAEFDADFMEFAAACPASISPEYAWLRTIQYAATHDPATGAVRVMRAAFSQVLSTNCRTFSAGPSSTTYDALSKSRLVIPYTRDAARIVEDEALSLVGYSVFRDGGGSIVSYIARDGMRATSRDGTQVQTRAASRDGTRASPVSQSESERESEANEPPVVESTSTGGAREPKGRDGGDSASPSPNGNGHADALSPDDLGVFEMLWRKRDKLLHADAAECDRLTEALRAKTPDAAAIRAFVERLTPSFVDDVTKIRRAFRMAANGRKKR